MPRVYLDFRVLRSERVLTPLNQIAQGRHFGPSELHSLTPFVAPYARGVVAVACLAWLAACTIQPKLEDPRARALQAFGPKIDQLKTKVDEWGTMSFAPVIFVPPSYKSADSSVVRPFAMTESGTPMDFNSLYSDYNLSQGQSLYGERTQTKTYAAYGKETNQVAGELDQAKLDLFKTSVTRGLAADEQKRTFAQQQYTEAKARYDAAKKAADETAAAEIEAKRKQSIALADQVAAPGQPEPIRAKAVADANVVSATANKTRADNELSAATSALAPAELNQSNALSNQVSIPGNGPTATSPTNPLGDISTADNFFGKMAGTTGANATNLAALGSGALPTTLVGNLDSKDNKGSFSPLARINAAAAAMTVKNIHKFLGNPEAAAEFGDRRIIFGVSSLSVNPGWRTKTDFKGVVNAQVTTQFVQAHTETILELLRDGRIPFRIRKRIASEHSGILSADLRDIFESAMGGNVATTPTADEVEELKAFIDAQSPLPTRKNSQDKDEEVAPEVLVHAVSPMVDSQNLDLASSIARQDEVALLLSAAMIQAGSAEAGKLFSSWAKLRRKDVATRSTLAVANSFTLGGGFFGFEIGTRLRGLDDDDAKGNKAAQTLDRQSFPVLLMFGVDKDLARPRLSIENSKIKIMELEMSIAYSTTWTRTHHGIWTRFLAERPLNDAYNEVLELGDTKQKLNDELKKYQKSDRIFLERSIEATKLNMGREFEAVVSNLHGANFTLMLPALWLVDADNNHSAPFGATVTPLPSTLVFRNLDTPATLVLDSPDINQVDINRVVVLGSGIQKTTIGARVLGRNLLAVELQATNAAGGSFQLALSHRDARQAVLSPVVPFSVLQVPVSPTINVWAQNKYTVSAKGAAGNQSGMIELILTGSALDRLDPPTLEGAQGTVTVTPVGPPFGQLAHVRVDIQSAKVPTGTAYLAFKIKGTATQVFSPPFEFELK